MTRQTSKGGCTFCHRELSKASLSRHLQACEQRIAMQVKTLRISGSQPFRCLRMYKQSLHVYTISVREGFDKRTSVTGRQVRPVLLFSIYGCFRVRVVHLVREGGNTWLCKEYGESPLELCRTRLSTVGDRSSKGHVSLPFVSSDTLRTVCQL